MNHLTKLNDKELLAYSKRRMPEYRKLFARIRGFLQKLSGKLFAVASSDVVIDVSGADGSIKVKDFKAPNYKTLKRHVSILAESDTIDELEYIVGRLQKSDSTAMRTQAKQLRGILVALIEDYNEAADVVENIANKHIPQTVADYFKRANKELLSFLRTTTEDKVELAPLVHVASDEDVVKFACYHDLTEYSKSPTWLVFSATLKVEDKDATFSEEMTVIDKYRAPLHFTSEKVGTGSFATHLRKTLALHGLAKMTSQLELKADEKILKADLSKLTFVSGVKVVEGQIEVKVEAKRRADRDLIKDVFLVLVTNPEIRSQMRKHKARLDYEYDEDRGVWILRLVG